MGNIRITVDNMGKLRRALRGRQHVNTVALNIVGNAAQDALIAMKSRVPVYKGRLMGALTMQANQRGLEVAVGHVRSEPDHAKYMEYGTGTHHVNDDYTPAPRQPYFPPPKYLAAWAKSKGMKPRTVALSIFKKGGLYPRKYVWAGSQAAERFVRNKAQAYIDRVATGDFLTWRP